MVGREAVGVAGAVESLVVVKHPPALLLREHAFDDSRAKRRVFLDRLVLGHGQRPRFEEHRIGNPDLADVVDERRFAEERDARDRPADLARKPHRQGSDTFRVAERRRVFCVHRAGEGPNRAEGSHTLVVAAVLHRGKACQVGRVANRAVTPAGLRPGERRIGETKELGGRLRVAKITDTRRNRHGPNAKVTCGGARHGSGPLGRRVGAHRVHPRNHPREGSAACGGDQLAGTGLLSEARTDAPHDLVATHLPVALVHEREAVEVDHHKR